MDSQPGTVERIADRLDRPPDGRGEPGSEAGSDLALTAMFGSPPIEEGTGTGAPGSDEAPAASLVGSLSQFDLSDVLTLLAGTTQTGELHVVSDSVDGRLWLDRGELSNGQVGAATTIGQAVFDLACVADGWFYFTAGVVSSSGQPPVAVESVLVEVRSQVDEWKEIRQVVPLDAPVSLCPEPPVDDVQIRSDQWRVLTTIGNSGLTVQSVLEVIGGDQIVGLRTLRDLHAAGLIVLGPTLDRPAGPGPTLATDTPSANGSGIASLPDPPETAAGDPSPDHPSTFLPPPSGSDDAEAGDAGRFSTLAEVAMMPPPIANDPWTPSAGVNGTEDNGVA
jgi:hypothetical protein